MQIKHNKISFNISFYISHEYLQLEASLVYRPNLIKQIICFTFPFLFYYISILFNRRLLNNEYIMNIISCVYIIVKFTFVMQLITIK